MQSISLSQRRMTRTFSLLLSLPLLLTLSGCSLPGVSLGDGTQVPNPGNGGSAPPVSESGLSSKEVLLYYTGPEGAMPGSEGVLRAQSDQVSYISGFWYQIDPNRLDTLRTMGNAPVDEIRNTVALAHARGVKVEALFHNLLYGNSASSQQVIGKLLADPELSARLAENMASIVGDMRFDGVNIDIEYVPPEYRQEFTRYVQIVTTRLHREGVRVSISVPAKYWDDPHNGWAGGYDYAALGAVVDRMILMTYDEYGYSSPTDGPVASAGWVRRVLEYAVQQVPAQKLLLGLPAYGFDWASNKSAPVYLDFAGAMAPVRSGLALLKWDDAAKVPKYVYTDSKGVTHKVWFENASSSSWKLDMVKEFGLRGFALWRAGMEDPELWNVVRQKMRAAK